MSLPFYHFIERGTWGMWAKLVEYVPRYKSMLWLRLLKLDYIPSLINCFIFTLCHPQTARFAVDRDTGRILSTAPDCTLPLLTLINPHPTQLLASTVADWSECH